MLLLLFPMGCEAKGKIISIVNYLVANDTQLHFDNLPDLSNAHVHIQQKR